MDWWNNNPSSYRSPPGPPPGQSAYGSPTSAFTFPTPDGQFGQSGYSPYGSPPGPPLGHVGPPPGLPAGPPSGPPSIPTNTYPGSSYSSPYPGPDIAPLGPPPGNPHADQFGDYGSPPVPPPHPPSGQQYYGPQFQGSQQPERQMFFQYSECNGRKKALCIGINYVGQEEDELSGCINDARNVESFLCEMFGYRSEDIVVLTDDSDQQDPHSNPTKSNIIRAMQWLVQDAKPNDSLFFHYSGHGGQTEDLDGDEDDGYDEVIYPVDYETAGHIVDDDIHDIMVKPLPPGCRLTAIFDSCHSGSALDLPYMYSTEGKIKEPNLTVEASQGLLGAVSSYARGDMRGVLKSVTGFVKTATTVRRATQRARQTKSSPADVISWSGCKDSQTSADAVEDGSPTGAMSYAFIAALTEQPQQSYQELLVNIRAILSEKYDQKPQLSCSHPLDTSLQFVA